MEGDLSTWGLALMLSSLIFTGCAPITEQPTETPTASPTAAGVRAPDRTGARDAALAYVVGHYGEQAPPPGLLWAEERTTPEDLIGSETFEYSADHWMVTISYPIVAPEAVVYTVVVVNQTTGFQWEGEVDAVGRVTGAPEGVVAARDAVLTYLRERYGQDAPEPGLGWTEEFIPPEGPAPSGTYPYTAGEWVIWVYDAGVEPQVYQVHVTNHTTDFQWEGEVDGTGQVTEEVAPL